MEIKTTLPEHHQHNHYDPLRLINIEKNFNHAIEQNSQKPIAIPIQLSQVNQGQNTHRSQAFTWSNQPLNTFSIVNQNNQSASQKSLLSSVADTLPKSLGSIIHAPSSSSPTAEIKPSRLKDSVLPSNRQPLASGTPMLEGIANAYSAEGGINSPQYQFVLKTINSAPLLLEIMNKYQAPIAQLTSNTEHTGFMVPNDKPYIVLNKAAVDHWHNTSLMEASLLEDTSHPLRIIGHEYGHVDYHYGTSTAREIRETFERRQQAWINSLPDPSIGLTGFDAQTFVDDIVTSYLATEGYADIQAWNVLHSARAKPPFGNYLFFTNKENGFTFNPDGTIPLTADNVYKSAQSYLKDNIFYKEYYFAAYSHDIMSHLATHAKPGDVIRLSGYDPNTIQRSGFQPTGTADTFIKT